MWPWLNLRVKMRSANTNEVWVLYAKFVTFISWINHIDFRNTIHLHFWSISTHFVGNICTNLIYSWVLTFWPAMDNLPLLLDENLLSTAHSHSLAHHFSFYNPAYEHLAQSYEPPIPHDPENIRRKYDLISVHCKFGNVIRPVCRLYITHA